ncbi:MAG: N-acetyltransferase [Alphaproteobacteria bacterium]|nr:N-acetyltransferase [Alphaproteobacteria bacterium]
MVTLQLERPEHAPAIERLLDQAFGPARWHKTCQRLRDGQDPDRDLSLVALEGGELVGTVRLWPVRLGLARRGLMLGPLAVDGSRQSEGIGATLMKAALTRVEEAGEPSVFLVGDPDYYRRFGFRQETTTGLHLPGPVARPRFLGREFRPGALSRAKGLVQKLAA